MAVITVMIHTILVATRTDIRAVILIAVTTIISTIVIGTTIVTVAVLITIPTVTGTTKATLGQVTAMGIRVTVLGIIEVRR